MKYLNDVLVIMDWIHCNLCFCQPGDAKKQFVLTSCGHIFCTGCYQHCRDGCKTCKTKCTEIKLTSKLEPQVQMYFTEPIEMMKKQLKSILETLQTLADSCKNLMKEAEKMVMSINQAQANISSQIDKALHSVNADLYRIQKVSDFQRGHRLMLAQANKIKSTQLIQIKPQYEKICKEVNSLRKEIAALKEVIGRYEQDVSPRSRSVTPTKRLSPDGFSQSSPNGINIPLGRLTLRRQSPDSSSPYSQVSATGHGIEELTLNSPQAEGHTPPPRRKYITSPPPRSKYITSPPNKQITSPPARYITSPPNKYITSPPRRGKQEKAGRPMVDSPISFNTDNKFSNARAGKMPIYYNTT